MAVETAIVKAIATETIDTLKAYFPSKPGRKAEGEIGFTGAVELLIEQLEGAAKRPRSNGKTVRKAKSRKGWSKKAKAKASKRMKAAWRKKKAKKKTKKKVKKKVAKKRTRRKRSKIK